MSASPATLLIDPEHKPEGPYKLLIQLLQKKIDYQLSLQYAADA